MDIIETIAVLAGSLTLLGVFLSIAFERATTKHNCKNLVSALNHKWQKVTVPAS
ncbi:MAG: hypothetical protein WBZ36_17380 [Candidatus Nitrosopolaris sp.]